MCTGRGGQSTLVIDRIIFPEAAQSNATCGAAPSQCQLPDAATEVLHKNMRPRRCNSIATPIAGCRSRTRTVTIRINIIAAPTARCFCISTRASKGHPNRQPSTPRPQTDTQKGPQISTQGPKRTSKNQIRPNSTPHPLKYLHRGGNLILHN